MTARKRVAADAVEPDPKDAAELADAAPRKRPARARRTSRATSHKALDGSTLGGAAGAATAAGPSDTGDTTPSTQTTPDTIPDGPRGSLDLLLIRHADAGDPATWEGDDDQRPLSRKGRRQARRLGSLLADLDIAPDRILSSPKVRAWDTARRIGRRVKVSPVEDGRLSESFGLDQLAAIVAELDRGATSVALVGHDPDFSLLLSSLVGANLVMRKGALARVELAAGLVEPGAGSLRWLLPPEAVPA
jgi:phosphohistidine phosphatase